MSDTTLEQTAVDAGHEVREFLLRTHRDEHAARLQRKLSFSRHTPVSVVVAGEPDTGRADLVDALLGRPALLHAYVRDDDHTDWTIRYGEQGATTVPDVADPARPDAVPHRSIAVDSPLLALGMTVSYPPCLRGRVDAASARASWGEADVLILVGSSATKPSRAEVSLVEALSPVVGAVIVVLTDTESAPNQRKQVSCYEQMLRLSAPPSTRIRVLSVGSAWKAEAGRLRSRGQDDVDGGGTESGFGELLAEVELLVSARRRLRSRAIVHTCLVHLDEPRRPGTDGATAAGEQDELTARLRRQLDRLRSFAEDRPAVLAGFDEELAALSDEICELVALRRSTLERCARQIDLTAVAAQRDLGYQLNEALADVGRALEELCDNYQRRAVRRLMEALREYDFELVLAAHDPSIGRPDAAGAMIDPTFAPREVSFSDVLMGTVHVVGQAMGARPDAPEAAGGRGIELAARPAAGALVPYAMRAALSSPLAPLAVVVGAALLLSAGAREAGLERARQTLRSQADDAMNNLDHYPARYREQIEKYKAQVWRELGATATRLAEYTAEKLDIAEQALDAERRAQEKSNELATLSRFTEQQLRRTMREILVELDVAAA